MTQRHKNFCVGTDCVTKQKAVAIYWYNETIKRFRKEIDAPTMDTIQPPVAIKRVLFKVTTSLYLRPSSKARSLSTLIAVSVINDTEHKVTPRKYPVKCM